MSDCIFCKIVNKDISSCVVAENEHAIAFLDAFPTSYGHCLIIPKQHYANLVECDSETLHDVIDLTKVVANKLLNLDIGIKGFNYLSNHNEIAGQVVMHFHVHVIPKYSESEGFSFSAKQQLKNDSILETKIESLIINK